MTWLADNIGTFFVLLILIAIVTLIIAKLFRDKRKGKTTCGCGCGHCEMAGHCHHPAA